MNSPDLVTKRRGSSWHPGDSCCIGAPALRSRCVDIYSDLLYLECPVLRLFDLGENLFSSASPVQHALAAACVPWLQDCFFRENGFSDRREALSELVRLFETTLRNEKQASTLSIVQSVLLMIQATTCTDTPEYRQRQRRWLQIALNLLPSALAEAQNAETDTKSRKTKNAGERARSRRRHAKRIFWTCYAAEQTCTFLRDSLENPASRGHATGTSLSAQEMEPLTLEDLELVPSRRSVEEYARHWSRMERGACYISRIRLCVQMAGLGIGTSQPGVAHLPGQLRHDESFWRVQAISDEFERRCGGSDFELDISPRDSLLETRCSLALLFCRIMIASTSLTLLSRRHSDSQGPGREAEPWQGLELHRVKKAIRRVLNIGDRLLQTPGAATADLLRALVVSAQALVILPPLPPSRQRDPRELAKTEALKAEVRSCLTRCLEAHEEFLTASISNEGDGVKVEAESPETLASESSLHTPRNTHENWGETPLQVIGEAQDLNMQILEDYDNMWNKGGQYAQSSILDDVY